MLVNISQTDDSVSTGHTLPVLGGGIVGRRLDTVNRVSVLHCFVVFPVT